MTVVKAESAMWDVTRTLIELDRARIETPDGARIDAERAGLDEEGRILISGEFTVVAGRRVVNERSKILTISDGRMLPMFSKLPLGALEGERAAQVLLPLDSLGLLHPATLATGLDTLLLSTLTSPVPAARGATSNEDGIVNAPGQRRTGGPDDRDGQGRSDRRHHRLR
jgi:hypothetical protein